MPLFKTRNLTFLLFCLLIACGTDSSPATGDSDTEADETTGDVIAVDESDDQTADATPEDRGQDDTSRHDAQTDETASDDQTVADQTGDALEDSDDSDTTEAPQTRVYVVLASHNEDTATGGNAACLALFENLDTRWEANRQAFIDIVGLVQEKEAAFSFQSDVEYLNILIEREAADDNFLRDLLAGAEGRFDVDAHAHESFGKNYADVANLLEQVTGRRNGVVGGFAAVTCSGTGASLDWEKFREPLRPTQGGASFEATLLTGGVSAGHRCEPNTLGLWRPASNEDFFTDDPEQDLPVAGSLGAGGGLEGRLEDIEQLVEDMRAGRLEPESMYPISVVIPQCDFDLEDGRGTPANVGRFIDSVNALDNGSGDVQWATFGQLVDIC